MNVLSIIKWEGRLDLPKFEWISKAELPTHFTKDSMNFNTIARAFAHDDFQFRYVLIKLCEYFNVENGDLRILDAYPWEDYKPFVEYIWKIAMEIAEEIHITN